jgi:hypothetical protein
MTPADAFEELFRNARELMARLCLEAAERQGRAEAARMKPQDPGRSVIRARRQLDLIQQLARIAHDEAAKAEADAREAEEIGRRLLIALHKLIKETTAEAAERAITFRGYAEEAEHARSEAIRFHRMSLERLTPGNTGPPAPALAPPSNGQAIAKCDSPPRHPAPSEGAESSDCAAADVSGHSNPRPAKEMTDAELADAIRQRGRRGKRLCAALVLYMVGKTSASLEDVAEEVHDFRGRKMDRVCANMHRTNRELEFFNAPYRFRSAAGFIHRVPLRVAECK